MPNQLHFRQAMGAVVLLILCACGGGGSGGGGGGVTVSLSTLSAVPGEWLTVEHPDIAPGELVEVALRTTAAGAPDYDGVLPVVAAVPGLVHVMVPPLVDAATGVAGPGAVEVRVKGATAPQLLQIGQPLGNAQRTDGGVLLALLEAAVLELQDLIDNLEDAKQEPGADLVGLDAQVLEHQASMFEALDHMSELRQFGTVTLTRGGSTATLGAEALDQLDDHLLAVLVGIGDAPVPGGVAPLSVRTLRHEKRSQTFAERYREAVDSLTAAGMQTPQNQPGHGSIAQIRSMLTDAVDEATADIQWGTGRFMALVGGFFTLGGQLASGALATTFQAGSMAITGTFAFVKSLGSWAKNRIHEIISQRIEGVDFRAAAVDVIARLTAAMAAANPTNNALIGGLGSWADNTFALKDLYGEIEENICDIVGPNDLFCSHKDRPLTNITSSGSVSASSAFSQGFAPHLGVDGNPTTNWFSDGTSSGGNDELFTWQTQSGQNAEIHIVQLDPETYADNDPNTADDYGFAVVQIFVRNAAGTVVHQSPVMDLAAFRVDVDYRVPGGATGSRVDIVLIGHQDPSCGGFSELRIFGSL